MTANFSTRDPWCLVSSPIFECCQRLIARKIAEIFSSNWAMSQFYEACGINDVSTGSVLCLFAASFGSAVFTATTLLCVPKPMTLAAAGAIRCIVAQWWHPVASNVAQDVIHREMCLVLQRWIAKAIETASEEGAFVCHCRFVVVHNLS